MFVSKMIKVYELTVQPPKIEGVFDLFAKRESKTFYFKSFDEAKKFSDAHYPGRKCNAKTRDAFLFEGKLQILADVKKPLYSRPVKLEDRKDIDDDIVAVARENGNGTLVAAKLVGNAYVGAQHTRIMSDAECFIKIDGEHTNHFARGPGGSEQCFNYYVRDLKYSPIQLHDDMANELRQSPVVSN